MDRVRNSYLEVAMKPKVKIVKTPKAFPFRLTITRPHGDIAYDQIIRPGVKADVTIQESIDYDAALILLGKNKEITLTRLFKIKIRRLE